MASLQITSELLIAAITQIHGSISQLESLRPSKQVNSLFTRLVSLCITPSPIDVATLPGEAQIMRHSLIDLAGRAEALLELEFASLLTKTPHPLSNLHLFPYYANYVKLANVEHQILSQHGMAHPNAVAFVGSGPMPLTSLVMATQLMTTTRFDNFDIDEAANDVARRIVGSSAELERRMKFKTSDVMQVREELGEYDCVILAALVGLTKEVKRKVIGHVRDHMRPGGVLLVRSAQGARAFLYPVVDDHDLVGFELLSVFHPTDDVINSVLLVRKPIF